LKDRLVGIGIGIGIWGKGGVQMGYSVSLCKVGAYTINIGSLSANSAIIVLPTIIALNFEDLSIQPAPSQIPFSNDTPSVLTNINDEALAKNFAVEQAIVFQRDRWSSAPTRPAVETGMDMSSQLAPYLRGWVDYKGPPRRLVIFLHFTVPGS
jgi:hypothetical protein